MSAGPRPTVVVFCKAPVPGRLKTRLTPDFAPEEAAALGTAMLLDVLQATRSTGWRTIASVAYEQDRGPVAALVPDDVEVCVQPEGDLGRRMAHEIARHTGPVAIVGADCPEISAGHIMRAFQVLDDGADAAICPARDGGYSLIAARDGVEALFTDIPWSSETVTARTHEAATATGLRLAEIDTLDDIDAPDDLRRLVGIDTEPSPIAARTRAVAVALANKRPRLAFSDRECQTSSL